MAFGTEAIIPMEIGLPFPRVESYSEETSDEQLRTNLDLVEEVREKARIRMAAYQQRVARYHSFRVKEKFFLPSDLVLQKASVSKPLEQGKLSSNWEGPYQVAEVIRPGTYKLQDLDRRSIPQTWNSDNLRRYYQCLRTLAGLSKYFCTSAGPSKFLRTSVGPSKFLPILR